MIPDPRLAEMAQLAARLVVEEGLDYASARRAAVQAFGARPARGERSPALTDEQIEDEVRAHIALFCADTQPAELLALRRCARAWMARLADFRPHLAGAVWRGTATRQTAVRVDLFCDDPKAPEIALINLGVPYDTLSAARGDGDPLLAYAVTQRYEELADWVTLYFNVYDHDALRGALKPDARGRTWRGDLAALDALLAAAA